MYLSAYINVFSIMRSQQTKIKTVNVKVDLDQANDLTKLLYTLLRDA